MKFEKRERKKKKLTRIRVKPLEHHLPRLLDPRRRQGRGRRGRPRVRVAEGVLPQVGRQLVHLRVRVERGARGVEVDEAAQPRGDLCRRHGLGERVVVARVGREESPFLFRVRSGELVSRRGSRRRRHGRGRDRQRRGRPRPSRSAPASGAPAPGHGRQPLEQPCRRGLRRELLDLPGPVRGLGLGRVDELGQQGGGAAADPARRGRGLGEGPLLAPRGQRGAAREHRDQVRPRGPGLGGDGLPSQQRRAARVSSPGSEGGDEGKHGRARARGDGAQAVVVDADKLHLPPGERGGAAAASSLTGCLLGERRQLRVQAAASLAPAGVKRHEDELGLAPAVFFAPAGEGSLKLFLGARLLPEVLVVPPPVRRGERRRGSFGAAAAAAR